MQKLPPDHENINNIASFTIQRTSLLDADGQTHEPLPAFTRNRETVVELYRAMVLTRTFDEKALALQRTGRLGTFASSLGQEAVSIGVASAMKASDVFIPPFREQGAQLWRGVTMEELLLYWGGNERGSNYAGPREDFPVSIPVATHLLHAAGVALAIKLRHENRCAVGVCGEGATSKGDFYEAINLAAVWQLPLVFVINNNQWAISVPLSSQTAAETLAQKAIAAGMDGVQVDGNDVFAVHEVMQGALERARSGHGPTLVEATTYRLSDHTTADDASRYRDDNEVSQQWKKEPLIRLRQYLNEQFNWTASEEEALIHDTQQQVEQAVEAYLATPAESPMAMFDYLYEQLPSQYAEQRAEVDAANAGHDQNE